MSGIHDDSAVLHDRLADQAPAVVEIVGGPSFEQAADDTILKAALRAGIGFPYECNSGGCGSCKFELLEGEVQDLWPEAPGLSVRDRQRRRFLACQSRACGPVRVKVRSSEEYVASPLPRRLNARLVGREALTYDLHEFRFETEGPATFRPGQYALLTLPGISAPRAYSMSNLPNESRQWHFQIRRVPGGQGTRVLFDDLPFGANITIDGPYGLAWLREDAQRDIICIAGGSGLAPMISIARGAAAAGLLKSHRLHFFYGARTPADVCGESLLRELSGYGDRLRYVPVVSGDSIGWDGQTGFVHEVVERMFGDELSAHEFYFAGPPPMTQAIQEMLMVRHRVPYNQIHFDRFF